MSKSDSVPINSNFSGKKWGFRFLLLLIYSGILSAGGTFSAIPDTSTLTVALLGMLATAIISIPIFWLTRNMFAKRHLQYGFYFILLWILGGHAHMQNATVESAFSEHLTSEVVPRLAELALEIDEGDIPYTDEEQATAYMREEFPRYWSLWEQMRRWHYVKTTAFLLMCPLLIMWGGALISYKRRHKKRLGKDQELTPVSAPNEAIQPHSEMIDDAPVAVTPEIMLSPESEDEKAVTQGSGEGNRPLPAMPMRCTACETDHSSDFKFCPDCGSPLALRNCPNCGAGVDKGFVFCSKCGNTLYGGPQP